MASSEQLPEASSELVHKQPLVRPSRTGRWWPVLVVIVVVVALAAVLLLRAGATTTNRTASSTVVPAIWRTFRDKLGTYTLRLPPGWAAQGGVGSGGTVGASFGSGTLTQEGFHFTDPSQGTGTAEVFISVNPITTAFDRQWFCHAFPAKDLHDTFHGLPAQDMGNATWIFETGNAHFQFDVTIPGVLVPTNFGPPPPPATPLPAAWVATDQTDVQGILASFQPSDPKSLVC